MGKGKDKQRRKARRKLRKRQTDTERPNPPLDGTHASDVPNTSDDEPRHSWVGQGRGEDHR